MAPVPPYKCAKCREKAVMPIVEEYHVKLDHDGRSYELVIPNLTILICGNCNNRVRDREANNRVDEALRVKAGLLDSNEIRQARLRLGLSQVQLAELLTVGEATLSRWETGYQLQSHHMDVMLRAFFEVPAFREYLEARLSSRNGISTQQLDSKPIAPFPKQDLTFSEEATN